MPRRQPLRRFPDSADRRINPFQHRHRLRTERPRLMLDVIERNQVQRQQRRMLLLQNPLRIFPAVFVRLHCRIDSTAIRPNLRRSFRNQSRRRNRAQQFRIVRRIRAPEFRYHPVDVRAHRHRPLNARRRAPRLRRRVPQRRHANIFRIPIPALKIFLQRIECRICVNSVLRRPHSGHQRGMTGISDRRHHALHPVRIRALLQNLPQIRNLRSMRIGLRHVVGPQPIDRNHHQQR